MQIPQDKFAEFGARLARIEGIVEQMETRLANFELRVDSGFKLPMSVRLSQLF